MTPVEKALDAGYRAAHDKWPTIHGGPMPAYVPPDPRLKAVLDAHIAAFLRSLEPTPEMVEAAGAAFTAAVLEHEAGNIAGAVRPFDRLVSAALSRLAEQVEGRPHE